MPLDTALSTDVRGLPLSGLNDDQVKIYDALLTDIYHYVPGTAGLLETLLEDAPEFVLGHVLRGYSVMTDGFKSGEGAARGHLQRAKTLISAATEREKLHVTALENWINGNFAGRNGAWEEIISQWPRDLLAYRQLTGTLFWSGDKKRQLTAALQTLQHWSPADAGYGLVLGPMAFALEEAGHYAKAEAYAKDALDINPTDLWSLHALAHVFEMQGRVKEGEARIEEVQDRLNDFNLFRGHIWWHLALFKMAQDKLDDALALVDQQIYPNSSTFYLDIQNAASALSRLEFQGVDVGDRWNRISEASEKTLGDHNILFTVPHQAMALARTSDEASLNRALQTWAAGSDDSTESRLAAKAAEAMAKFQSKNYAQALEILYPIRFELAALGASHAQQDIYFQYMVMAASELSEFSKVRNLLRERIAARFETEDDFAKIKAKMTAIDSVSTKSDAAALLRGVL
jgi:tetratricopeptide (TPR) repeat protein